MVREKTFKSSITMLAKVITQFLKQKPAPNIPGIPNLDGKNKKRVKAKGNK